MDSQVIGAGCYSGHAEGAQGLDKNILLWIPWSNKEQRHKGEHTNFSRARNDCHKILLLRPSILKVI